MVALLSAIEFISCKQSGDESYGYINSPFKISVLNVGKADCILIEIDNNILIIDTGKSKSYSVINKELKERNIRKIDYLILSHLDKDHIGGVPWLLEDYNVEILVQPDYKKDNEEYIAYIQSLEKHNKKANLLHEALNIKIGNGNINIYAGKKSEYKHSNDYSLIVDINYMNNNFLFMGDAEKVRLAEFIKDNKKKYDFVKIPHHGRIDDLTEDFLKSVLPKCVAITCSKESGVDEEVKLVLNKLNIKNFFTCNGNVILESDGEEIIYKQ